MKTLGNPDASLGEIFSAANSNALLWASMVGTIVAIFTTVINGTFKVNKAIDAGSRGRNHGPCQVFFFSYLVQFA